jgi:ComF family protein
VCGQEHVQAGWVGLCADCWSQIHAWSGPACIRCGLPIASQLAGEEADWICGKCRAGEYEFDFARSYGVYTEPLRSAILLLKFQRRERLGRRLGELLAAVWAEHVEFNAAERPILAPVPLHKTRQRERGFNQAEVLADGLARRLKVDRRTGQQIETRCLLRIRPTVPQTGLSFKQRLENVRGVFRVKSREAVLGRVIVLVDDVMTTGATLSSCASALKKAGAERVLALTLARATPQFPDVSSPGPVEAIDDFG